MPQSRPNFKEMQSGLKAADRAVVRAAQVRKRYRRRKLARRESALQLARAECAEAAEPLRSWLGMAAWGGIRQADEISMKKMMERLRYERRQIDKML